MERRDLNTANRRFLHAPDARLKLNVTFSRVYGATMGLTQKSARQGVTLRGLGRPWQLVRIVSPDPWAVFTSTGSKPELLPPFPVRRGRGVFRDT